MRTEEAISKAEESPVQGDPDQAGSVPGRPVIVIADGAFKDRGRLINHFEDVEFRFADVSDPAKLSEATAGASGIVVTLQPMRAAHIGALAPSVRVIGRAGVGLDTIDLDAATEAGITVLNQPTYGTREVASHAVALLLALQRRLRGVDAFVRDGWSGALVLGPMKPLDELVVGLVGAGRIGRATAEMLLPLVGHIMVYDPAEPPLPHGVEAVSDLKELLVRSDVVSLHLPLTADTANMVDEEFLATMAPGAMLVNVSRGGLVDEAALVAALDSGHIGGVALDVFATEPLAPENPLLAAKNTLFSPHCASYSDRSVWFLASWTIADTVSWVRSNTVEHGNVVVRGDR
jgi:D-3-phosphoglycerate dehydrogenase / 2-oxoglutarate reductase